MIPTNEAGPAGTNVAVWAHGRHAASRWHRVALVSDNAIVTGCERIFAAPVDLRDKVPLGEFSCRPCAIGFAEPT